MLSRAARSLPSTSIKARTRVQPYGVAPLRLAALDWLSHARLAPRCHRCAGQCSLHPEATARSLRSVCARARGELDNAPAYARGRWVLTLSRRRVPSPSHRSPRRSPLDLHNAGERARERSRVGRVVGGHVSGEECDGLTADVRGTYEAAAGRIRSAFDARDAKPSLDIARHPLDTRSTPARHPGMTSAVGSRTYKPR